MSGWGILGGLGKGMSDYSVLLTNKREDDWKAKQDELQHQREISLENLRSTNAQGRQTQRQTWETGQQEARFAQQDKTNKTTQENIEGNKPKGYFKGVEITTKEYNQLTPAQQGQVQSKGAYSQEQAVSQAVAVSDAQYKQTTERNRVKLEAYKKTASYRSKSPEAQANIDLAFTDPNALKLIATMESKGGLTKGDKDNFNDAYNKAVDTWDSQSEKEQKEWKRLGDAKGIPAISVYAASVASQSMGGSRGKGSYTPFKEEDAYDIVKAPKAKQEQILSTIELHEGKPAADRARVLVNEANKYPENPNEPTKGQGFMDKRMERGTIKSDSPQRRWEKVNEAPRQKPLAGMEWLNK